jgi:hypothetical protein
VDNELKSTNAASPSEKTIGRVQPGDKNFFYHPGNNKYYFIRGDKPFELSPVTGRSRQIADTSVTAIARGKMGSIYLLTPQKMVGRLLYPALFLLSLTFYCFNR